MYEMYASLMQAAATGHSAPSRRRSATVTRSRRGRGRGLDIKSHAAGRAGSATALRPACAGVDATAR
jgi:hypothetical protein